MLRRASVHACQQHDAGPSARPRRSVQRAFREVSDPARRSGNTAAEKAKSAKAVTGDVLAKLLATCGTASLRDIRDRAILMVAFASGGRRRSEIASLRREQLTVEVPIPIDNGPPLPSLAIHLGVGTRSVQIPALRSNIR
jgi:integrase